MKNASQRCLEGQVGGGGSTETLLGLEAAVDSVAAKSGNRAVLAIFDVVDTDEGNAGYQRLWDKVLHSGIVFSTIGVKSGWEERSEFYGNSRQEIFRELACATQGQLHHSPSDELVALYAEQFFKELTAPMQYRVRATWPAASKPEIPSIPSTPLPPSPGRLSVRYAVDAAVQRSAATVELVLDSSNSMSETVARVPKYQIARTVLKSVLADLPRETHLGLRLYGHRGISMARDPNAQAPALTANDPRLNEDSQLVVPIRPLTDEHRREIEGWLEQAKPNGKTPLVYSLLQALGDFPGDAQGARVVVLISDGKENCGGKLSDLAVAYRKAGVNAVVHVIGFDLERDQEAKRELGAIARLGSGVYFDARDASELATALRTTVRATSFEVLDPKTRRRVIAGIVGGPLSLCLPECTSSVRLRSQAPTSQRNWLAVNLSSSSWIAAAD